MRGKVFHRGRRRRQRAVGPAVQVPGPRPRRAGREADAVALRETRDVGLEYGDGRHAEEPRGVQPAVAEQGRRRQMHDVGIESAQHADHPRPWHAQRQRRDLREHPRRHPVNPDAVVNLVGRRLAARGVRGDDECLVTGAAEMLDHPKHRVGDAVDIREEGLCDDRNAHAKSVPSAAVAQGCIRAYDTQKPRANDRPVGEPGFEYRAHKEGRLTCGFPGPVVMITAAC